MMVEQVVQKVASMFQTRCVACLDAGWVPVDDSIRFSGSRSSAISRLGASCGDENYTGNRDARSDERQVL